MPLHKFIDDTILVSDSWFSSPSRPLDKRGIWKYNDDYYLITDPGFASHYRLYRSVGTLDNFVSYNVFNLAHAVYPPALSNARGSLSWNLLGNKLYAQWMVRTNSPNPFRHSMMVASYDFETNTFDPQVNTSDGPGHDISDAAYPDTFDAASTQFSYHVSTVTSTGKVYITHPRNAQNSGRGGKYVRPGLCYYNTIADTWTELNFEDHLLLSLISTGNLFPVAMMTDTSDNVHIILELTYEDGVPAAPTGRSLWHQRVAEDGTFFSAPKEIANIPDAGFIIGSYPTFYPSGFTDRIAIAYTDGSPSTAINLHTGDLEGNFTETSSFTVPTDEFNSFLLAPYGYGTLSTFYFNGNIYVFYAAYEGVTDDYTGKLYYNYWNGSSWSGNTLIHEEYLNELGNPVPSEHNGTLYVYFAGVDYDTDIDVYQSAWIWTPGGTNPEIIVADSFTLLDSAIVQLRDSFNFPLIEVHVCPEIIVASGACASIKTISDTETSITSCEETIFTETSIPC